MKNILYFAVLLCATILLGQEKTVQIDLPEDKMLIGLSINDSGDIYIKTGKQKIGGYFHKTVLESYDKNLEKRFYAAIDNNETIIPPLYVSNFFASSKYGAYFQDLEKIIDQEGKVSSYPSGSDLRKQSNLNTLFRIFSDQGYSIIGPESGRKNVKKKYDDDDLKIWTRLHKDGTTQTGVLETPNFITNKKFVSWQLGEKTIDGFYLVAKDDLNESKNLDRYHLSFNDFNGKLLKHITLEVKLDEDHFLLSKTGHGFKEDYPSYNGIPSYSGILPDSKNEHIYAYGYYTHSDKKQVRVGKIAGLYVQKFNLEGNLIWKKKYPFEEVVSEYLLYRKIHMLEHSENRASLNYSYDSDEEHFMIINVDTGDKITEKRNYRDDFKENKNNGYKKEVGLFNARWYYKKLKGRFFGGSLLKTFITHPEVKTYIEGISSDNTLYFESYYLKDEKGLVLMEFNGKKRTLKLTKFKS